MVCGVAGMNQVASVGRGQVAVSVGPVGGVPPVGTVVVLVSVLDVLGRVVVVVVVVGGWVLLQVAVLGMVPMARGLHGALGGSWVVGGQGVRWGCGQVGLGRGLPSLTPE